MRCRYTFAVTSDAALPASVCFKEGVTDFTFVEHEKRFVAVIVEQRGVPLPTTPKATLPATGIPTFTVPSDPLLPFIQMELRAIRGALAMWRVYDIDVNRPQIEWHAETEAEKASLQMTRFKRGDVPLGTREPGLVPIDQLIRPFISRRRYLSIEIPLEYFRRGQEDIAKGYYIEAIYDFYFVLEYLFADGKFTKHAVRDAMLGSEELKRIILESQSMPLPDVSDDPSALAKFKAKYEQQTLEQVVNTLTELRGLLHHQSQTRKNNWNPSVPDEFKADAFFLCAMAHSAVLNLSTQLAFVPEEDEKFKATALSTPDGRKIRILPLPEPPPVPGMRVPPPAPPKA